MLFAAASVQVCRSQRGERARGTRQSYLSVQVRLLRVADDEDAACARVCCACVLLHAALCLSGPLRVSMSVSERMLDGCGHAFEHVFQSVSTHVHTQTPTHPPGQDTPLWSTTPWQKLCFFN